MLLWLLRRRTRWVRFLGLFLSAFLAILAQVLPVAVTVKLGPLSFKVADTLVLLGRKFTLSTGELPLITIIYAVSTLWFLGALSLQITPLFVPHGLGVTALLVAALAVDPFLYAALLIEVAVLISIPMLASPGETVRKGLLRYLIFQTLGMPFILFTGWMLTGIETGPLDPALMVRTAVLLGLGFAFLLAVFPFYSWIPLLAEQGQPFVTGFILVILPTVVLFFALDFLTQYTWFRELSLVYSSLRAAGALMVATGGLWAAFQRQLGRILGYAIIAQIGFAILALGSPGPEGLSIFAAQLLPFIAAVWLWSYALSIFGRDGHSLTFASVADGLRSYPFASSALLLANMALAGLPLLAGFPFRMSLLVEVAQASPVSALWVFVGSLGLLVAGVRSLAALAVVREAPNWQVSERPVEAVFLVLGILFMLILGWFPQLFLPGLLAIAR
jgi:formate hydrogenlyase subunit 3/multisubunit Na+/H+ antiporter MnhD subunit